MSEFTLMHSVAPCLRTSLDLDYITLLRHLQVSNYVLGGWIDWRERPPRLR